MARSLVIVESPAKAKTINKYLGRNYHGQGVPRPRDGPAEEDDRHSSARRGREQRKEEDAREERARRRKEKTSRSKPVTLDDDKIFEPTCRSSPARARSSTTCAKPRTADAVYLAGDPDREGEAISAHLAMVLSKPTKFVEQEPSIVALQEERRAEPKEARREAEKERRRKRSSATDPKKIFRVTFNEITPKAIRAAFENPRQVDTNLVDAQQARRVLDRIVGYKISPLLWDKVRRGLSAGRVQTVALRLIVEREQEIRAFVPQEYWTIHAMLDAGEPPLFEAKLFKYKGEDIEVHESGSRGQDRCRGRARRSGRSPASRRRKRSATAAAVHHFETAAGCLQPAALHRQAHHDAGAAAV